MTTKQYLMDVVLIRLTLIFLLVFMHAFCPFTRWWQAPPAADFHVIEAYKWLALSMHHFRLEAMVFISGLLFGYTLKRHPERLTFRQCILKKAKRILLPGILFSTLYYLLFFDHQAPWYVALYKILCGCGHLWFLPMLFWCFVLCYLLEHRQMLSPSAILSISTLALFLPGTFLLGIGRVPNFFFYFYLGFAIQRAHVTFPIVKKRRHLLLLPAVYIVCCICNEMILDHWPQPPAVIEFLLRGFLIKLTQLLCAVSMLTFLYSIANKPSIKHWLNQHPQLITLSGYCYGVYIYHLFILMYLYYHTPFTTYFPTAVFPWVGFLITLALSLLLCYLTLKTGLGRYVIG